MKATTTPTALITEDYYHKDEFEIVEEFPQGYVVWNIGRENFPFPGYLPLAKPLPNYHIERSSLKTVKVDEALADVILKHASIGTFGVIDKYVFENLFVPTK